MNHENPNGYAKWRLKKEKQKAILIASSLMITIYDLLQIFTTIYELPPKFNFHLIIDVRD
jgi:hypothetical protein